MWSLALAAMLIKNEKVLREQLIYEAFHEVNIVTAHAGTASGMSGIITFGEKDPDATLLHI